MILSWAPGIQKIVMQRVSQGPHFKPKPQLTGKKQSRAGPEKQKMKCKWQMNRSETVQIQSHKIWSTALLETTTTPLLPWAEWTKPRRRSKTRARGTIVPICTKETYRIYTILSSSSFSPNKENVRSMQNTKFNIYHSIIFIKSSNFNWSKNGSAPCNFDAFLLTFIV